MMVLVVLYRSEKLLREIRYEMIILMKIIYNYIYLYIIVIELTIYIYIKFNKIYRLIPLSLLCLFR